MSISIFLKFYVDFEVYQKFSEDLSRIIVTKNNFLEQFSEFFSENVDKILLNLQFQFFQ